MPPVRTVFLNTFIQPFKVATYPVIFQLPHLSSVRETIESNPTPFPITLPIWHWSSQASQTWTWRRARCTRFPFVFRCANKFLQDVFGRFWSLISALALFSKRWIIFFFSVLDFTGMGLAVVMIGCQCYYIMILKDLHMISHFLLVLFKISPFSGGGGGWSGQPKKSTSSSEEMKSS